METIFILCVLALIIPSQETAEMDQFCQKDICQLAKKIGEESYKREIFETDMKVFIIDHSLKLEHNNMKRFLDSMGKIIAIEDDIPLQAFVIQYQQQLHEEAEANLKQHMKNILQLINDTESTIVKKLDEHFSKTVQEKEIEILKKKLDAETVKNRNLTEELQKIKKTLRSDLPPPFDCLDIQVSGKRTSGVYTIYPKGKPFQVYCDMDTDGGGWTVFILRQKQDEQLNFTRTWKNYKDGFGSPPNEYWLGLDALNLITSSKRYSMRADVRGDGTPSTIWGEYSNFRVASEWTKYQLTITGFNRNSTLNRRRNFGYDNKARFSTIDSDNDMHSSFDCAKGSHNTSGKGGGFWFNNCSHIVPTQPYNILRFHYWSQIDSNPRRVRWLQMKIRPYTGLQ